MECQTGATRMEHKCDTVQHERNMSATHKEHECSMSATRTTRKRHESKILILITTRVRTYFLHPYISYIANDRLQGEEQFCSKNYLLEKPRSYQNAFEKCSTKTELCNAKSYVKKLSTTTMDKILDKL